MTQTIDHLNPGTLSAYIDSELSAEESRAIQQHLATCHTCALEVLSATQVKAAITRAGRGHAPSPEVLERLKSRLQPERARKPAGAHFFRYATVWAVLTACLIAGVSLVALRHFRRANTLSAELLDQHLATLSSDASPEVVSTDRHTVKPWFEGKLPFSFNLPGTLPPDTVLRGGDLAYLEGQPAALLLFTIRKHKVSVFLAQRTHGAVLAVRGGVRSGFAIHEAKTRNLQIIAVSDVDPEALDRLLSNLAEAQSPD